MRHYYEQLNKMPEELRTIVELCWDETGRPMYANSYQIAVGWLLPLCNDWGEFTTKYQQLFFNEDTTTFRVQQRMELAWHSYTTGMKALAAKLGVKI